MTTPTQILLLASQADKVIHRFNFLFRKPPSEMRSICITTASKVSKDDSWVEKEKESFRQVGFELKDFDLTNKEPAEVAMALAGVDMIYVLGGNTFYLLEKMRKSDFEKILKEHLHRGVLYVGSSAGSIVTGPDIAFIEEMANDPSVADLNGDYRGLALMDFSIIPHVGHERFGAAAASLASKAKPEQRMIGLRDDQAIVVKGSYAEIF